MTRLAKLAGGLLIRPEETRTYEEFLRHAADLELLIAGQSDIKNALIPSAFGVEAYNFADTGESFIETYYKLRHHLDDMPRLRVVILPLSIYSFSSFRTDRIRPLAFRRRYIRWSDIRELYRMKGWVVVRQKLLSYAQMVGKREVYWFLRRLKRTVTRSAPPPPPDRVTLDRGHRRLYKNDVRPHRAKGLVRFMLEGSNLYDPHLLDYFERTLRLCADRGLRVVTVACPLTDLYLEAAAEFVTPEQFRDRILSDDRFTRYIDRHLDHAELFPERHEYFADQNHLNHRGAEVFSRLVAEEIADLLTPEDDTEHSQEVNT